jgi:hypothetical protein
MLVVLQAGQRQVCFRSPPLVVPGASSVQEPGRVMWIAGQLTQLFASGLPDDWIIEVQNLGPRAGLNTVATRVLRRRHARVELA